MERETSMVSMFLILKKKIKTFFMLMIGFLILTIGFTFFINETLLSSSATLMVGEEREQKTDEYNDITEEPIYEDVITYGNTSISDSSKQLFSEVLESKDLLEEIIGNLNLDISVESLRETLSMEVPDNSSSIIITVSSSDVERPDQIVDEVVTVFKENLTEMVGVEKYRIMNSSSEPQNINTSDVLRNTVASVIISFVVSVGLVLVIAYLDDSVQSENEIREKLNLFVIGQLQSMKTLEEDLRKIRTNLEHSIKLKNKKTIVFASPDKKYKDISVGLLDVLTEANNKVLLIDTDFRNPTIQKELDISNDNGLSNFLKREASLVDSILPYKENSQILTTGTSLENPSEQLSSDKMRQLLTDMREKHDYIIINGHPINEVTDTVALSTMTDGVILLVEKDKTTVKELEIIKKTLVDVDVDILGVIFNSI